MVGSLLKDKILNIRLVTPLELFITNLAKINLRTNRLNFFKKKFSIKRFLLTLIKYGTMIYMFFFLKAY